MLTDPASQLVPRVLPLAHPLDDFYAKAGLVLPPIESVSPEALPDPYKALLVHDADMTSTLERFHGGPISLKVLRAEHRGDVYCREVVLVLDRSGAPVEFGAIKISLSHFSPEARRSILEGQRPLGHILHQFAIPYTSRPKAFLRLEPDDFISGALGLTSRPALYGRRNTLADPVQLALAEIVEILVPSPDL